jgi:predicted transcriptional regulator
MIEQEIVEVMNQIRDNLWLGDVRRVKEIITNFLKMKESARKFQRSFKEVSTSFRIAQKICKDLYKERKGFEYELSLSKEFKERIREPSKLKEAIIGLLIFDFEQLLKRLEIIKPLSEVIQKPSYRYTIFEYLSKYELRALIEGRVECNVRELVRKLEERGFKLSSVFERRYVYITAFSTQGYIEILALLPKVSIFISLLTPNKEYAQELGEMIINSLIS